MTLWSHLGLIMFDGLIKNIYSGKTQETSLSSAKGVHEHLEFSSAQNQTGDIEKEINPFPESQEISTNPGKQKVPNSSTQSNPERSISKITILQGTKSLSFTKSLVEQQDLLPNLSALVFIWLR